MGISNTIILLVSLAFLLFFLLKIKKHGYLGMHMDDPEPAVSDLVFDDVDEQKKKNDDIIEEVKVDEEDKVDDEEYKIE